jgi:peptidoglycan DL-endopeptidase CwlO
MSVTFTTVSPSLRFIGPGLSRTERDSIVAKRLASTAQVRRGAVLAAVLTAVSGYALYAGTGGAGAAPAPTISQVQAQVNSLQARVDKIGELYDGASQQYTAAKAQLTRVTKQASAAQALYDKARAGVTAVAVETYEDANQTSVLGLLSSSNPSAVLAQASLVTEVAGSNNAVAVKFLTAAQALTTAEQARQRTEDGVVQLKTQLAQQKNGLTKLLSSKKATLDSLTVTEQATVAASTVGATTTAASSTPVTYTGPTSTQADQAIAYAYSKIGDPYVWGATGPDSFDCSGLVQAAWGAAGVAIPRTTYDDWASLPHIPMSEIEPGDLILYDGEGHVALYIGDGYIIDAPSTGLDVEKIPQDTDWYAQNTDGAVRP